MFTINHLHKLMGLWRPAAPPSAVSSPSTEKKSVKSWMEYLLQRSHHDADVSDPLQERLLYNEHMQTIQSEETLAEELFSALQNFLDQNRCHTPEQAFALLYQISTSLLRQQPPRVIQSQNDTRYKIYALPEKVQSLWQMFLSHYEASVCEEMREIAEGLASQPCERELFWQIPCDLMLSNYEACQPTPFRIMKEENTFLNSRTGFILFVFTVNGSSFYCDCEQGTIPSGEQDLPLPPFDHFQRRILTKAYQGLESHNPHVVRRSFSRLCCMLEIGQSLPNSMERIFTCFPDVLLSAPTPFARQFMLEQLDHLLERELTSYPKSIQERVQGLFTPDQLGTLNVREGDQILRLLVGFLAKQPCPKAALLAQELLSKGLEESEDEEWKYLAWEMVMDLSVHHPQAAVRLLRALQGSPTALIPCVAHIMRHLEVSTLTPPERAACLSQLASCMLGCEEVSPAYELVGLKLMQQLFQAELYLDKACGLFLQLANSEETSIASPLCLTLYQQMKALVERIEPSDLRTIARNLLPDFLSGNQPENRDERVKIAHKIVRDLEILDAAIWLELLKNAGQCKGEKVKEVVALDFEEKKIQGTSEDLLRCQAFAQPLWDSFKDPKLKAHHRAKGRSEIEKVLENLGEVKDPKILKNVARLLQKALEGSGTSSQELEKIAKLRDRCSAQLQNHFALSQITATFHAFDLNFLDRALACAKAPRSETAVAIACSICARLVATSPEAFEQRVLTLAGVFPRRSENVSPKMCDDLTLICQTLCKVNLDYNFYFNLFKQLHPIQQPQLLEIKAHVYTKALKQAGSAKIAKTAPLPVDPKPLLNDLLEDGEPSKIVLAEQLLESPKILQAVGTHIGQMRSTLLSKTWEGLKDEPEVIIAAWEKFKKYFPEVQPEDPERSNQFENALQSLLVLADGNGHQNLFMREMTHVLDLLDRFYVPYVAPQHNVKNLPPFLDLTFCQILVEYAEQSKELAPQACEWVLQRLEKILVHGAQRKVGAPPLDRVRDREQVAGELVELIDHLIFRLSPACWTMDQTSPNFEKSAGVFEKRLREVSRAAARLNLYEMSSDEDLRHYLALSHVSPDKDDIESVSEFVYTDLIAKVSEYPTPRRCRLLLQTLNDSKDALASDESEVIWEALGCFERQALSRYASTKLDSSYWKETIEAIAEKADDMEEGPSIERYRLQMYRVLNTFLIGWTDPGSADSSSQIRWFKQALGCFYMGQGQKILNCKTPQNHLLVLKILQDLSTCFAESQAISSDSVCRERLTEIKENVLHFSSTDPKVLELKQKLLKN